MADRSFPCAPPPGPSADATRLFVTLIAIDRFEALKRTIGYAPAAAVLTALADAVRTALPGLETIRNGRGTIEASFAADSAEAAATALERLAETLARRIDVEGFGFDLAATMGAADTGGQPLTEDHVGAAERALATAQRTHRRVVLADVAPAGAGINRLSLMRDLQQAIRDDRLAVHYQPKLRARSGKVAGAEALVRWSHSTLGQIPPDRFVPIAEETGDIAAMTDWVIDRALADQRAIAAAGHDMPIHVNISGVLLGDTDFAGHMLDRIGPAADRIGFEITETAMIADPASALGNLRRCAEGGIKLSIDDYGAGFSSLAYLQQLPVDELKIDRSFISRLTSHQRDPLLVRSTIDLAHALEMEVTAEGVDSPHALALLQVMGCDLVQGFYLSRPIPLADLHLYLQGESARLTAPPPQHRLGRRRVPRSGEKGA